MGFNADLKLEKDFYDKIFKPWLRSVKKDSIFIHFNSNSVVYASLQKEYDIDLIIDDGVANITVSLKTVRKIYDNVFFETISNCNTNSPGWGIYSKADYIVYSMGNFQDGFTSKSFQTKDVLALGIEKYRKGYGKTTDHNDNLLYKTEGRLIPFKDFKHGALFEGLR